MKWKEGGWCASGAQLYYKDVSNPAGDLSQGFLEVPVGSWGLKVRYPETTLKPGRGGTALVPGD